MANIIIAGVGGQGTLLASKIIGCAAIAKGYDVKVSEVHGMSQRGGSVVTYVRYSSVPVQSPIVDFGQADIILAFETLEAYRSLPYLKKDGKIIINTQVIPPMPVITGSAKYPEDIINKLKSLGINVYAFDAVKAAHEAGSEMSVNVCMLGQMAKSLEFPKQAWLDAVKASVKPQFENVNIKAFELGFEG